MKTKTMTTIELSEKTVSDLKLLAAQMTSILDVVSSEVCWTEAKPTTVKYTKEDFMVQYIYERIEVLKDVMVYNEVMVYIDEFEPIFDRYKCGLKLNELAEDLKDLYKEFKDMDIQVRTVNPVNQCPF